MQDFFYKANILELNHVKNGTKIKFPNAKGPT